MQHGHMDQVGYDTYCKLLDEVIKESKGITIEEEKDVTIDINVSSYISNEFIENENQKIEVYQKIALCRNDEELKNIVEDIEDRYGKMPQEVDNLIGIARIKEMCKNIGIIKITQKQNNIVFYFEPETFIMDIGEIVSEYGNRIKVSSGISPYITYKLKNEENVIKEIIDFLKL